MAVAAPLMVAEVQAALDQGDAQRAANLAQLALRQQGISGNDRASLLLYRGLAHELLGAHASAMRDLTDALAVNALPPDERGQALLQRGFLRDGQGRLSDAIADYSAVIALNGYSSATALNNRANIYLRQNKLPEARKDYLAALSADGGQKQQSYFGLGRIAETEQDSLAARGFYAKAVIADPDYAAASERLAALGGPPDGVLFGPEARIVLRPPASLRGGGLPKTDNADLSHAQAAKKEEVVPRRRAPVERTSSIRRITVNQLALRPALDQSDSRPSGSGGEIQLGAWRSEAEAQAGWEKAKADASGVLDGLVPRIRVADLPGKGRYFRLRVTLEGGQSGAAVCTHLAARTVACLPVRN